MTDSYLVYWLTGGLGLLALLWVKYEDRLSGLTKKKKPKIADH